MAATVSGIKTRCPEFAATATATIELAITDTALQLNRSAWGSDELADLAHTYLAAHILKLQALWAAAGNAPSGQLQSVKDGDLSKTYGLFQAGTASEHELMSTAYGREFVRLRGMAFATRII